MSSFMLNRRTLLKSAAIGSLGLTTGLLTSRAARAERCGTRPQARTDSAAGAQARAETQAGQARAQACTSAQA